MLILDFDLENEALCDGCDAQVQDSDTGFWHCSMELAFGAAGCDRRQSCLNMQGILKDACFALAAEMEDVGNEVNAIELRENAERLYL